jgi:hypothetical protein
MKNLCLYVGFIIFALPFLVSAHPGGTDASGCHTCRTNCPDWGLSTGEYHCHNTKALPQPEEPIRSHYGEDGTGTTEPWPEYEALVPAPVPVAASVVSEPIVEQPPIEEATNAPGISLPVQAVVPSAPKVFWFIRFLRFFL